MKQCKKTPYTKKEAKKQQYLRSISKGLDPKMGGVYWCRQHNAYHISRVKFPIISEIKWKRLKK